MPGRHPRLLGAVLLAALAAHAGVARGQESAATAESLFDDGRRLLAENRYAEACAKFTESERLDPAVGTLLNLGDCYEKMGKIATAWAIFKQTVAMAERGKQPAREKIASLRVTALEPKIPRLVVKVLHPEPGLEVRRDGVLLGAAEWAPTSPSAVATDPGDHDLVASAPGKKPWTGKVTLAADGQTTTLEVPALETDDLAERAPLQPRHDTGASLEAVTTHDRDVERTLGIIIGSVGIVSILVGVPFGARAVTLNKDARGECPTNTTCQTNGASDASGAVFSGTLATVLFVAGGAVTTAGVVLYLSAPSPKQEKRPAFRLVPTLGPGGVGVSGSF